MGLISGSLTFFRLHFQEALKLSNREIQSALEQYSFNNLFEEEKFVNYGFVPFDFPVQTDFLTAETDFDGLSVFGVRIDEKKVNKKYFDIEFERMKNAFMQENGKTYLTKTDKEFIKNALNTKLLKNSLPSTSIVEVILNQDEKCIYVSALNTKVMDILEHLFRLAFEIAVYRESMVENVRKKTGNAKLIDDMLKLTPYNF
ncbi:MAG: hypothetical protein JG762_612 [Deferribacteraceae bacterium]|jgi:DNA recombination-dependent growth factor C|nr:hypothetical protein [Deferribacteraceae bacterium]